MQITGSSITEEGCLNCGSPVPGNFCPKCGQERGSKTLSLQNLVKEFINDQFGYDSKLWRTLKYLLFRPGHLTNEYVIGKRVPYLSPFRTYLFLSVAFFLIFAWRENPNKTLKEAMPDQNTARQMQASAPAATTANKEPSAPADAKGSAGKDTTNAQKPGNLHIGFAMDNLPPTREAYDAWQRDPKTKEKHSPLRRFLVYKSYEANKLGPAEFLIRVWDNLPKVLFALMPLFALLLKLLYLRSKRLYIEHLIFALHSHAFVFVALILTELCQTSWVSLIMYLLIVPVYFFRAMRAVYRQSFWKTMVKFWLLGGAYFSVLLFGIVLVFFVTLLQI